MRTEARVNHSVSTVLNFLPSSRPSPVKGEGSYDRASAQDKAFLSSLRGSITTFFCLFIFIVVTAGPSFGATAKSPEEIWKKLEKLSPTEREKKLIEGAKSEGEMIWHTNSGLENDTRYIQAFKKNYPFINAQVWRSKTRQVIQRVIAEANAGRHMVDVIKPSTDLLPVEGRVVAHPRVDPIYPRMKELQSLLGTSRVQLNTVEQNHKLYKDGLQILDEIVLKRKSASL